jgi:hypothetical protein
MRASVVVIADVTPLAAERFAQGRARPERKVV